MANRHSPRERQTQTIRILGIVFALGLLASAVLGIISASELFQSWRNPLSAVDPQAVTLTPPSGAAPLTASPVIMQGTAVPLPSSGRINILLMGLDLRERRVDERASRSDSMIVLTIDRDNLTAGMLSLPRDLWVEIPGFGFNRINTAYFYGEAYRTPGGGGALAMQTVSNFLDIPITHFLALKFSAFENIIDQIGGVEVFIEKRMRVSRSYRTPVWLDPGWQTLDGATLLGLARNRSSAGSDFDRSSRQQYILMAIFEKVTSLKMVPTLIANAASIYGEAASGVSTNFGFDDLISLGLLAARIPSADIERGIIAPPEMVYSTVTVDGAQVLVPVEEKIAELVAGIFHQSPTASTSPGVPPSEVLIQAATNEGASIEILNGGGASGIATQTADYLKENGLNVVRVGNADRLNYVKTIIIDYTHNPETTALLKGLMDLSDGQILGQMKFNNPIDIRIILGADWVVP